MRIFCCNIKGHEFKDLNLSKKLNFVMHLRFRKICFFFSFILFLEVVLWNIWLGLFQAMVLFVGVKSFKSDLHPIFGVLCKDPHVTVRQTMASCFHEVGCFFLDYINLGGILSVM